MAKSLRHPQQLATCLWLLDKYGLLFPPSQIDLCCHELLYGQALYDWFLDSVVWLLLIFISSNANKYAENAINVTEQRIWHKVWGKSMGKWDNINLCVWATHVVNKCKKIVNFLHQGLFELQKIYRTFYIQFVHHKSKRWAMYSIYTAYQFEHYILSGHIS